MYKLYGRKGSGSLCVQVLLEEAGAPYEMVWVDDLQSPAYLKINPNGKVPALQLLDGQIMYQSAAMMAFLAQALPGARMAPEIGTSRHALMLQWLVLLSTGTYESVLRYYYSERYGEAVSVKAKATEEIDRIHGVIEADLTRKVPTSVATTSTPPTCISRCWRAGTSRTSRPSARSSPRFSRSTIPSPRVHPGKRCRRPTPASRPKRQEKWRNSTILRQTEKLPKIK